MILGWGAEHFGPALFISGNEQADETAVSLKFELIVITDDPYSFNLVIYIRFMQMLILYAHIISSCIKCFLFLDINP